jgi:phosphoadenosine phosphosulfate reductase
MSFSTEFSEQPAPSTSLLLPVLSPAQIEQANQQLADAEPQTIIEWAIQNVPGLYQTTAFGLTGLAATDMISKISQRFAAPNTIPKHLVPLIFIDTLYHFPETLALADQVSRKYGVKLHVYTPPKVATQAEFEAEYGQELWTKDEDSYDYLVKVSLQFHAHNISC